MNVNDGTEPCPACHSGIPWGTIKLHAEINRLRAELERIASVFVESQAGVMAERALMTYEERAAFDAGRGSPPISEEKKP